MMESFSVFHLTESGDVRSQVVKCSKAPDIRQSFNGAYDEIQTEQTQQCDEPPGIIHVRNIENLEEFGHVFAVLLDVDFRRFVLRDNCTYY